MIHSISNPYKLLCLIPGALLLMSSLLLQAVNDPERPNVIFITVDQQRFDFMTSVMNDLPQYNGKPKVRTPAMDRLRAEGAYFKNFYTQCAVCGPARGVYRSGKTLENNGVQSNDLTNDDVFALDPLYSAKVLGNDTFDMLLVEELGYRAEQYGKWHIPKAYNYSRDGSFRIMNYNDAEFTGMTNSYDYSGVSFNFDPVNTSLKYSEKVASMVPMYAPGAGEQVNTYSKFPYTTIPIDVRHGEAPGSTTSVSQPDQQGRNTLPWDRTSSYYLGTAQVAALERMAQGDEPFVMSASFHSPHAPFVAAPVYYDYYAQYKDDFFMPPSISGSHLNNSAYNVHGDPDYQDEDKIREWMITYYGLVEEVDVYVGDILDKLDEYGIADNTMVICTSDHGEMLGAHGMREKNKFLEESAHVTMLVRYPAKIPAGITVEEASTSLDIYATILDYCNIPQFDSGDGKTLRRFIERSNYNKDYDDEHIVTEWDFRTPKDTDGDGVTNGLDRTLGGETNFLSMKYPWKLMMTKLASSNRLDMLYNIETDPYEMNNLVGNNGMSASDEVIGKAEHLKALLGDWMTRLDYDGNYSDPIHNEGVGTGDINEIKIRRKWRTVDIWVSDTEVSFGPSVDVNGQFTRNEYIYLGRTNGGALTVNDIVLEGADAGFFQLSGFTGGNCASGNYKRVKVTYLPNSFNQTINDARVVIKHNAGADRVVNLSSRTLSNSMPVITSVPAKFTESTVVYNYTIDAADNENDPLTYSAPVLPTWLTFSAGSRLLSGTPSVNDHGIHDVELQVTDGNFITRQIFKLRVSAVGNDAPIITSIPGTAAIENQSYNYIMEADDADGDAVTFAAFSIPGWLSFDAAAAKLSGTPAPANIGLNLVTLTADDGSTTVQQTFYINVFATPLPTNIIGNHSFESGGVQPSGWTVKPGGTRSEDIAHEGSSSMKMVDTQSDFEQVVPLIPNTQYNVSVWFHNANQTGGRIVFDTQDKFDGNGESQFVLDPGDAPNWINLTGTFNSGIETSVKFRAFGRDNATHGNFAGAAYFDNIVVAPVGAFNVPPVVTSIAPSNASEGNLYYYRVLVGDAENDPITVSEASPVPAWLNLNAGVLSGTPGPSDIGDHNIQLQVSDGTTNVPHDFTISVGVTGTGAPVIMSTPNTGVIYDNAYNYTLAAIDPDGDNMTYDSLSVPTWASFDAGTRVLSGTPGSGDVGLHLVELTVSDGTDTVQQSFNISVFPPPLVNLITNGSFESGDPNPDSWVSTGGGGTTDAATTGTTAADGTSRSLMVVGTDKNRRQTISLQQNTDYVLSAWIDAAAVTGGNIVIDTSDKFDPGMVPGGTAQFAKNAGSANGWTYFSGTFNSATETSVTIRIFPGGTFTGTAYVDQLVLAEAGTQPSAPEITSVPVLTATVDEAYSYKVLAADAENATITYSSLPLPGWLTFNPSNQVLSGTPGAGDVGDHSVELQISSVNGSDSQQLTITVSAGDVYEDWKTTNGVTQDDGDEDGDGVPNLLEFALGGDPNASDSDTNLPDIAENTNSFDFTFNRAEESVTYIIEKSTDLSTWTEYITVNDSHGVSGGSATVSVPDTEMSAGKLFLRLKVE